MGLSQETDVGQDLQQYCDHLLEPQRVSAVQLQVASPVQIIEFILKSLL